MSEVKSFIEWKDTLNRVLIYEEMVKQFDVDFYGHLHSAKYVEFFGNQRWAASQIQANVYAQDFKEMESVPVIASFDIRYLRPSLMGDTLEIASYISEIYTNRFLIHYMAVDKNTHEFRCVAKCMNVLVSPTTGKPHSKYSPIPCRGDADQEIKSLPIIEDYLSKWNSIPRHVHSYFFDKD